MPCGGAHVVVCSRLCQCHQGLMECSSCALRGLAGGRGVLFGVATLCVWVIVTYETVRVELLFGSVVTLGGCLVLLLAPVACE